MWIMKSSDAEPIRLFQFIGDWSFVLIRSLTVSSYSFHTLFRHVSCMDKWIYFPFLIIRYLNWVLFVVISSKLFAFRKVHIFISFSVYNKEGMGIFL